MCHILYVPCILCCWFVHVHLWLGYTVAALTSLCLLSVCGLPHLLQVLCLSEQILFTQRCEEAISGGALQELLIELEAQLAGRPQECVRARVCVYVCVCVAGGGYEGRG